MKGKKAKTKEPIDDGTKKDNPYRKYMGGEILANEKFIQQLPFIIYTCLLILLYMQNNFSAESVLRKTNALNKRISELRSESLATHSDLVVKTKRSEISFEIGKRGLEMNESLEPPFKIFISDEERASILRKE